MNISSFSKNGIYLWELEKVDSARNFTDFQNYFFSVDCSNAKSITPVYKTDMLNQEICESLLCLLE